MAIAAKSIPIKIPFTELQFELTARDKKVMAVALASIAFFSLQMGAGLVLTVVTSSFLTGTTYLAEVYLRAGSEGQNDWFGTGFDNQGELTLWVAALLLRPFFIQLICSLAGVPFPIFPQTEIVERILSQPWKMIPLATVIAPFAEEILFRGVLLERLEDGLSFFNRHICTLSQDAQKTIANVAQAIIFGAAHLRAKVEEGTELFVVSMLSFGGYIFGKWKNDSNQSLLPSIALHSANNISFVTMLRMAK